jgi:competence protein ComEA
VLGILVLAGLLMTWHSRGMSRWNARPLSITREVTIQPIDLNRADETDLRLIPGLGPELTKRVLNYRFTKGDFSSVEQLSEVAGIGPATLLKIRPYFYVRNSANEPAREEAAKPVAGVNFSTTKKPTPTESLNLNAATLEDLQKLPGIGPTLAGRIVEYRKAQGSFTYVEDLRKVKGIGAKTLDKIRPYIHVGGK